MVIKMKNETFKYKGFEGSMEFSTEDQCLIGEVLCISGKVVYEAQTFPDLKREFEDAVDAYLEHCAKHSINPEKSFSGSFTVRSTPELHKALVMKGYRKGLNFNQAINAAIQSYVDDEVVHQHNHHHSVSVFMPSAEFNTSDKVKRTISSDWEYSNDKPC